MTYLIIHQLGVMRKALDDTRDYLKKKKEELDAVDARIGEAGLNNKFNNRQKALLGRAMHKPDAIFTVEKPSPLARCGLSNRARRPVGTGIAWFAGEA